MACLAIMGLWNRPLLQQWICF